MYQGISKFKTGILALAVITVLAVVISGCGGNQGGNAESGSEPSGSFNVIGSNTVTPLTSVWAEERLAIFLGHIRKSSTDSKECLQERG